MLHWLFLKTICSGFSGPQRVPSIVAGKFVHIFFAAVIFFGAVYVSERLKKPRCWFLNRWWCSSLLGVRISWVIWWAIINTKPLQRGRCRQVEVEWRTSQTHSAHLRRRKAVTWAGFGWLPGWLEVSQANIYQRPKTLTYCWWFRNPAPVNPIFYRVLYIPGGCLASINSTIPTIPITTYHHWFKIYCPVVGWTIDHNLSH